MSQLISLLDLVLDVHCRQAAPPGGTVSIPDHAKEYLNGADLTTYTAPIFPTLLEIVDCPDAVKSPEIPKGATPKASTPNRNQIFFTTAPALPSRNGMVGGAHLKQPSHAGRHTWGAWVLPLDRRRQLTWKRAHVCVVASHKVQVRTPYNPLLHLLVCRRAS